MISFFVLRSWETTVNSCASSSNNVVLFGHYLSQTWSYRRDPKCDQQCTRIQNLPFGEYDPKCPSLKCSAGVCKFKALFRTSYMLFHNWLTGGTIIYCPEWTGSTIISIQSSYSCTSNSFHWPPTVTLVYSTRGGGLRRHPQMHRYIVRTKARGTGGPDDKKMHCSWVSRKVLGGILWLIWLLFIKTRWWWLRFHLAMRKRGVNTQRSLLQSGILLLFTVGGILLGFSKILLQ